jgi:uncharacterized protein (TIGR03118 family)
MRITGFLSVLVLFLTACGTTWGATAYQQTNLVSDIPGMAAFTDPNLKDPWGVSFSPTSPLWVSDRATGVASLYNGLGAINPLVVAVPPGAPNGPTGQVFAGGTDFRLNGNPVNFIFATLGGTIAAWNGGTTATTVASTPGAGFTGLALGNNTLFAANFIGGTVNAFNSSFAPTTLAGNFTDPNLPAGYAPFNVQTMNGRLYVEYAKQTPGVPVALPGGGGYVDVFDFNGNFVQRLVSNGVLDGPWGVTMAPAGFGDFGGALLVGNFGNYTINAFDPLTGSFLGTIMDASGNPIENDGLWTITFDLPNGAPGASNPNQLFFTAGLNDGNDGLLGSIAVATPEPGALGLLGLGAFGIAGMYLRKRFAR